MLPTRSCYLLLSFLSVQNLYCQVRSLFTVCEADKLRSSFENTLSNSPVLFFPGYNDIITSYRIGGSSEANRNISSSERKVKVQLPSLKSFGFFISAFFPCSHLTLFGHTVGTGVNWNDGNDTCSVCGTDAKFGLQVTQTSAA